MLQEKVSVKVVLIFLFQKNKSTLLLLFPQQSALRFFLSFPLLFFTFLANKCTTKVYYILGANKYERDVSISSLQSTNTPQFLQM